MNFMKQAKNTINRGDGLKDTYIRNIKNCVLSDDEWLGSIASDRSEQGYDVRIKRATFKKLFGFECPEALPRVRFAFGWASTAYLAGGKNFDARVAHAAHGCDWFIHVRPDVFSGYQALAIPKSGIAAYFERFGREKHSVKKGWFIQLDGYALSMTGTPARKWQDFCLEVGGRIVDVTEFGYKAEDLTDAVNKTGRVQAQVETSNPYDRKRKLGSYYAREGV